MEILDSLNSQLLIKKALSIKPGLITKETEIDLTMLV